MATSQSDLDELEAMINDLGGEDITIGEANDDDLLQTESEDETINFNEEEDLDDDEEDVDGADEETDDVEDEFEDDDGAESSGDEKDFEPITVKVNGYDVTIDSKEDLMKYVNLGASQFGKEAKQESESDLVVKQGNLSAEDLKLLVEAKKGSKEAIAKLAKNSGIDILDVDAEMADSYKQTTEYQAQSDVDRVATDILSDEAHKTHFQRIANTLPDSFMKAVTSNADDLKAFSNHIKSGLAEKAIPLAIKYAQTTGASFLDAYIKVGREMSLTPPAPAQKEARRESPAMKEVRKRASSGKATNTSKKVSTDASDVWDASGDDWEAMKDSVFN